ncbi:hypothetical protein M9H77_07931 [Catharanthus roseus]|uniref:Uncharacterized protein n=1 Tax=Catharanthus roseus TaxID=4058 RepID=A0ACC0BWD1_CATRO|nr:hypothetical protein M9H77_07931 [Catharanthus roseus]
MQQSIEGLARQFQSVTKDIEELKKGKNSAMMEQRVGDNLGGLGGREHYRPQEKFQRHEAWHKDNLYEDYRDNLNFCKAYHSGYYGNQQRDKALDKINVVSTPQASTSKSWPKREDTRKVAFKDHPKPNVGEKGRLITNPTRCFKCNGVGHIAVTCIPRDLWSLVKT